MRQRPTHRIFVWLLLGAVLALGCDEDFEPIERVQGLRIMAISADAPDLAPGDRATIRALVRSDSDASVSYQWDWCPFPSSAQEEYACPLGQEDLNELGAELGLTAPLLALGSSGEVELHYNFSELLVIYCELLAANIDQLPTGEALLECEDRLSITLRLIATQPDGQRVIAVKQMNLLYEPPEDPETLNANPFIDGVSIFEADQSEEQAVPLLEGEPYPVAYGTEYTILLNLDTSISETFTPEPSERDPDPEPKQENLLAFWYYEGGGYEKERTGYIEDVSTFENLETNTLTTPYSGDYSPGELNLYFVLQDERGGIGWTVRTLRLP